MAEWVIAEAKGFHGLRRARQPGLEKFKIQALLIASLQNLKRLVAAGKPPTIGQFAAFEAILKLQLVVARSSFGNRLFTDSIGRCQAE